MWQANWKHFPVFTLHLCHSVVTTDKLLIPSEAPGSRIRLPRFQRDQFRVLCVAPVQVFAVAFVVVHEGRHLRDGGGRVGRGAHGAVVLSPLTPLGLILHPLPLQSCLHLDHTKKQGNKNPKNSFLLCKRKRLLYFFHLWLCCISTFYLKIYSECHLLTFELAYYTLHSGKFSHRPNSTVNTSRGAICTRSLYVDQNDKLSPTDTGQDWLLRFSS